MTASNGEEVSQPLFPPLSADDDTGLTEIESLCMNCEEHGTTKFLLIQIPFFREIVISSFHCPSCGFSNSEIQSAGAIQEKGVCLSLLVKSVEDLNRQVVRTDVATLSIPEVEFEIPANTQKGTLTTIEGILQRAIDGLNQEQPVRRALDPELAGKIDDFIGKLTQLKTCNEPFTLKVDDPSGNSFIENPHAPRSDPNLTFSYYIRSLQQDKLLGLKPDDAEEYKTEATQDQKLDLTNEAIIFNTNCPSCNAPCETKMKMVNIPHFKEIIIMASDCDACGHRSNEVKSGSGFEPKGKKITLKVTNPEDVARDVLKSETCSVEIPELGLETGGLAISGKFTTVEGLILDLKKTLIDTNPFVAGDSAKSDKLKHVGEKLVELSHGNVPFTLILDDPNSNSYIQDLYTPEVDPSLSIEVYERTYEQNEELGLNDMKTENYS